MVAHRVGTESSDRRTMHMLALCTLEEGELTLEETERARAEGAHEDTPFAKRARFARRQVQKVVEALKEENPHLAATALHPMFKKMA